MRQESQGNPSTTLTLQPQPDYQSNTFPWKTWAQRYRTRRQLRFLLLRDPQRLVEDLGISEDRAREECAKPFWR